MEANAPKKFYYAPYGDIREDYPITDNDIEYIRTDAFIEKACDWLRNNSHNYANNALGKEYLVNDFKEYIEGE